MSKPRKLIHNTPEEEAAIARGIAADPGTFEPTNEQFAQMKRRSGRPKLANPKVAVTVHYDVDVVECFKASGEGWQTLGME
ncbi:BrnA antitoxin family protein [Paraburkholderia sp. J12]|uniref:BrnA antitoxin family protein n=1 Tax=Paraburkholderia sp. J12 TaxID=2805432 RepID=UPI002ABDB632|nr:BrnA antitoxin family protein [Paraburkholderia sp. J12]